MPNPPEGTAIDYYLKAAASGPVTLEILGAAGQLVRRYSSADPVPPAPDVATSSVPLYWYRPPQRLSSAAGMHRFYWDLRYQPLGEGGGGRGGLGIQAIPYNTAPATGTPLVVPATYTVKLTVDGKSVTEPLTVKQDPRVRTPALVMQQVYALMSGTYFDAVAARAAQQRAAGLRTQVTERLSGASGAAKTSLDTFARKLDSIAPATGSGAGGAAGAPGGGRGRGGPPAAPPDTLAGAAASLGGLINALGAADVQPTANQVTAITAARATAAKVLARWRAIESVDLPALNAALKAAGLAPVK
jgi:hypothetical protein